MVCAALVAIDYSSLRKVDGLMAVRLPESCIRSKPLRQDEAVVNDRAEGNALTGPGHSYPSAFSTSGRPLARAMAVLTKLAADMPRAPHFATLGLRPGVPQFSSADLDHPKKSLDDVRMLVGHVRRLARISL